MYPLRVSHRLLATMFVAQSLFSAAQISIITLHSIAAGILGGSDAAAGLPTTMVTFAHSIMAYFMGIIMGRYGRRMGLVHRIRFGLRRRRPGPNRRAQRHLSLAANQLGRHGHGARRHTDEPLRRRRDLSN